jgi:hypothetical protein
MADMRRVEARDWTSPWREIEFKDIKSGMLVRLFESTGEPVIDKSNGSVEWLVTKDAELNADGILYFAYECLTDGKEVEVPV